ncbi:MAG TPA: VTT domain-containing protein [Agriterribacter sp.]|nr:VTT domain-containing protein [Agriterribacter sp.]
MTKRIFSTVLCIMMSYALFAQEEDIKFKVVNQYEETLNSITLTTADKTTDYFADKDGFITIKAASSDSVTIGREGYSDISYSTTDFKEKKTITLYKDFSGKDLMNPMFYIINGGLWLLLFIVFAETGLFVGFFLPGDSLLFVAGIYSSNLMHEFFKTFGIGHARNEWIDLFLMVALISLAGIIGNMVGYWFGRKIGPAMYGWKDRLLFKRKYLNDAHDFYEKHGGGAIIFARFLPIIRTFAPIVGGIVQMDRKKFMFYNIVGCVAWVISMIFAGHFLQIWVRKQFGFELRDHLEMIVIIIVLVTTLPVLWKLLSGKKIQKTQA